MMQVKQIFVLCAVSYVAATVNIYLDGPVQLLDCRSQKYVQMVESTTSSQITEDPDDTPNIHAARKVPVGSAKQSQAAEGPVDPKAFYEAAAGGDINYINAQLDKGKEISSSSSSNRLSSLLNWHNSDKYDRTALHVAAENGHVPVVVALLEAGASPNALNSLSRSTPMHYAALKDHAGVLRALLKPQYQANVNQQNEDGITPVYWAAWLGKTEALEVLLDHGADVHLADSSGWTPLIKASTEGHVGIAESLITAGARVDDTDNFGRTALFYAAIANHPDVALFLLQNGANKRHRDNRRKTAADRARLEPGDHDEVADLIDNWQ